MLSSSSSSVSIPAFTLPNTQVPPPNTFNQPPPATFIPSEQPPTIDTFSAEAQPNIEAMASLNITETVVDSSNEALVSDIAQSQEAEVIPSGFEEAARQQEQQENEVRQSEELAAAAAQLALTLPEEQQDGAFVIGTFSMDDLGGGDQSQSGAKGRPIMGGQGKPAEENGGDQWQAENTGNDW